MTNVITYLRSYRVLDMAIFDWVATLALVYYLAKNKIGQEYFNPDLYYILLIPLIIFVHKLFGVKGKLVEIYDCLTDF